MAATQSLLAYLETEAPQRLPTHNTVTGPNTTNTNYEYRDITQISAWPEFNYNLILQQYGTELNACQIMPDPMPTSPPRAIRDEPLFHARFCEYILPRIRRALRRGFEQLRLQLPARQLTPVAFDGGTAADLVLNYKPDTAFVDVNSSVGEGKNRCPGDLKVSWKWKSEWQASLDYGRAKEYSQVLSQVNFYMKQNGARYSFIITDTELVPVKRLSGNGHVAVATAIPWTQRGPGQLTVLLGLWYLGMLAASSNWEL
ncbi:hypothetical protein AJ80_07940 [Polytolypa hystricis UAMH7299]|uniref:Fungal-type protein kinase domain-containing protein n=1 Tax=Polytolypa hystricis (strain UAMH7299) TaxID=1447883 RepID=A0A2B7XG62_POLH7|nr:hypothetical protein AJ80_07940 [Polytolypa hystricis UAMH7299]